MPYPLPDFFVQIQVSTATQATNQVAIIAPFDMEVEQVQARFRVGSTSGTLDVVSAADGTAVSAGTSLLNSTVDISTTPPADTLQTASMKTSIGSRFIPAKTAVGLKFAGTVTGLLDLDITIYCRQKKENQTPLR